MAELQLGNIKPAGADNVVVDGKYVKGGYFTVANIEERDALTATKEEKNIVDGSLCYCQEDSVFYKYASGNWSIAEFDKAIYARTADHADKADKATKADQLKIGTKYYTVNVSSTDVLVFEEV